MTIAEERGKVLAEAARKRTIYRLIDPSMSKQ